MTQLRKILNVPMSQLHAWLGGTEPVPTSVFLTLVDLLEATKNRSSPPAQRQDDDTSK
jgi:hypothetical protein